MCTYDLLRKMKVRRLKPFFPHDKTNLPLIFARNLDKPYGLHYLETRDFRATPRIDKVEYYITLLDRVENHKGCLWKDLGIFDLIKLLRQGPRYQKHMLLAALYFWNSSTNSLHLKCGKPIVETFNPVKCKSIFTVDFVKAACGPYIKHQHKPHNK